MFHYSSKFVVRISRASIVINDTSARTFRFRPPATPLRSLTSSSTKNHGSKIKKKKSTTSTLRKEIDVEEDPHQMADRFVRETNTTSSPDGRMSGTEALEDIPPSIKLRNVAMATVLVGFVTGVWYYSMTAVGRADEVSFDLEVQSARERALLEQSRNEQQQSLVRLEMGATSASSEQEGHNDDDDNYDGNKQETMDITAVAVAAPDDVASKEEDENRAVVMKQQTSTSSGDDERETARPLWKRIVLFWKK